MPSRRKGGAGPAAGEVHTAGVSAEAAEPIGTAAEHHLSEIGMQDMQNDTRTTVNKQTATLRPLRSSSAKKRKTDDGNLALYLSDDEFADAFGKIAEKVWQRLVSQQSSKVPEDEAQQLRDEMQSSIKEVQTHLTQLFSDVVLKMQAEAEKRAEAMMQRVMQALEQVPQLISTCATTRSTASPQQESGTQSMEPTGKPQGRAQSKQATQPTWSKVVRAAAQSTTKWTTVVNKNKRLRKQPLEQRRILFIRNDQAPKPDPRDIMFEVNKALAHAKVDVAVRLTNLRYTMKGHLSGLMNENASADDLLRYGAVVFTKAREVDPAIIDLEKTERWRKLRVHGVALDRYLGEGGLELAQEEIELTTGISLAYKPHWIKNDTLVERYDSGAIRHSTLVVTVKSKQVADTMLAKGVSFGGRRHEVERFWLPGEGGICTHCCGPDHFGKCTEPAQCFVCAGEHEGSKHRCAAAGCAKKSGSCDHKAAKCANCGGSHMAISRRCPERMQRVEKQQQTQKQKPSTEMRSSPPAMSSHQPQSGDQTADAEPMDEDVPLPNGTESTPHRPAKTTEKPRRVVSSSTLFDPMSDSESDLETITPSLRRKEPSPMPVDNDSATA